MGNLREHCYSFEDGAKAGDAILELIVRVNPELKEACEASLSEDQQRSLFDRLREVSKSPEPMPSVEGLLSKLVKPAELESSLMTIWGFDEFWRNQLSYAPICDISPELGFVQIGSWCGDSDGDAWIIDSKTGRLAALSINLLDYDADTVRDYCYQVFNSPWQWFSFLRCLAWERGWIPSN